MSGPLRPNVVAQAADALEKMRWRPFDAEKPASPSRVLVCRQIGSQTYVDVVAYIAEEPSGLPPLCNYKDVVAWMPLPEPPA
jgi:hypothetical protein